MRNLTDIPECWACPITAAYQGEYEEDKDPNFGKGGLLGETATIEGFAHSAVFVEVCRESFSASLNNPIGNSANNARMYLKKVDHCCDKSRNGSSTFT